MPPLRSKTGCSLRGLSQCPDYGHWASYCCVALEFGSGLCLGSGFGCALPLLARVLGCVCACVRTPLVPATPGWGVRCGCVCSGSGFGCAPPLLAGVSEFVSACVCALLVPCESWLGCAVWVCVLGLWFRLPPATPSWGVGLCLCLCACSACTPPMLAGVCGVGVCRWAWVSAEPRHSWLGCCGVRVCVRALLVPCPSWLGCAVWVCVLWLGFWLHPATPGRGVGVCVFVCALCLYPATPGRGVRCGCVCFSLGSRL